MVEENKTTIRKTSQNELPKTKSGIPDSYDIYPTHQIEDHIIHIGYDSLAKELASFKRITIDGYVGIIFSDIKTKLSASFEKLNIKPIWINVERAFKDESDINSMISPFLGGDDPVFGKVTHLNLMDFFDKEDLNHIASQTSDSIIIYYGLGASLLSIQDTKTVYFEISKNEIQFRSRAGSIYNLGAKQNYDSKIMYKRFYFIDWIVMNKHKNKIKYEIDYLVDGQRSDSITWMQGDNWRRSIKQLVSLPIRVRPWFEPGVWGGQWIKDKIKGLNQDVVNYAWSFELILPENGIIVESSKTMLEFSFDFLMFFESESILGTDQNTYGYQFPIRFDFLDTFNGGNLSVQCHPQLSYIKEHFGETITQEETYYILDCTKNAHVYLGFQEGIEPKEFEGVLSKSIKDEEEVEITKYVRCFKSNKHDLFLIPPGTIHSAGRDNLVLEISSTPYIFTFKMYDWLRPGLDGKPRPLNLERGMNNLVFDYAGDYVEENLISKPRLIESNTAFNFYHLPTHKKHLYDVHRYEIHSEVEITMQNKAHIISLVEGDRVQLVANGTSKVYNYAESVLIPASVKKYSLKSLSQEPIIIVKAFIK